MASGTFRRMTVGRVAQILVAHGAGSVKCWNSPWWLASSAEQEQADVDAALVPEELDVAQAAQGGDGAAVGNWSRCGRGGSPRIGVQAENQSAGKSSSLATTLLGWNRGVPGAQEEGA